MNSQIISSAKSEKDEKKAMKEKKDNVGKELVAHLNDPNSDIDKDAIKQVLKNMTAEEAFVAFDTDDDGLINFDEFRKILPYLNIKISDAKSYRYFKMCDTRKSERIDIDDFKAALFACDPVSYLLSVAINHMNVLWR
jgi:EF hand